MKVDLDEIADRVNKIVAENACGFGQAPCDHKTCEAINDVRRKLKLMFENVERCPTCNGTGKRGGRS